MYVWDGAFKAVLCVWEQGCTVCMRESLWGCNVSIRGRQGCTPKYQGIVISTVMYDID